MTKKQKPNPASKKKVAASAAAFFPEGFAGNMVARMNKFSFGGEVVDIDPLELQVYLEQAHDNYLKGNDKLLQNVLLSQIDTMNACFYKMVGKFQAAEYLAHEKLYAELAIQFQNHTRRTVATLADMRNPRQATFVRQANIAQNQQINNGQAGTVLEPEKNFHSETQVSEQLHVEALDARTAEAPIGANSTLEAVGKIHRAKVKRR